jgi:cytidylate kinase
VVAIDGPAGAGKTTVSRLVAERLGYRLVGTGALYRCVALAADRCGVSWQDEAAIGALAQQLADRGAIQFVSSSQGERVLLDQEDVSVALRSEHIGAGASRVSAIPAVRDALLAMQRGAGRSGGVVLEGRDIGTAVFPDAEAKFFLTASVQVRAQRRYDELRARGVAADLQQVLQDAIERDRRDRERAVAPLCPAPDAAQVDGSELTVDQVVDCIVEQVRAVQTRMDSRAG